MPAKRERVFNRPIKRNSWKENANELYYERNLMMEINRAEFLMEFKNHVESLHF